MLWSAALLRASCGLLALSSAVAALPATCCPAGRALDSDSLTCVESPQLDPPLAVINQDSETVGFPKCKENDELEYEILGKDLHILVSKQKAVKRIIKNCFSG